MKKSLIINFIVFIISGVIFGSIGVCAGMMYSASDISYNGNKTNVEKSLNDLYSLYNNGDAVSSDIIKGKTAYVNGKKIVGTR